MDITFCDLCNESVPQADIELGWAVRRGGRLICVRCDAAMTAAPSAPSATGAPGAPGAAGAQGAASGATATLAAGRRPAAAVSLASPAATGSAAGELDGKGQGPGAATGGPDGTEAPAAGGRGGSGVGWVALVFGSAAIAFLVDRGRVFQAEVAGRFESVAEEARAAERRGDRRAERLSADLRGSEERLTRALAEGLEPVRASLAELQGELDRQALRWEDLKQEIELARADADARHSTAELTFERHAAQLKRIDEDLRFYRDRIIELEEGVRGIAQAGVPVSLLPGGGATTPPDGTPRWSGLLPDLEHASAAIRLEAVYALGDTKDPLVVPHLIPRLSDSDMFVRLATARILEALGAKTAVPDLIDALEDRESAVREAAVSALRTITSRNFRFDPAGSEEDRADAVREWRNWWQKSSKSFLEG